MLRSSRLRLAGRRKTWKLVRLGWGTVDEAGRGGELMQWRRIFCGPDRGGEAAHHHLRQPAHRQFSTTPSVLQCCRQLAGHLRHVFGVCLEAFYRASIFHIMA